MGKPENPSARTFRVTVQQIVEVTLDVGKFDDAFMAEFRESFYSFDTLDEHVGHIAQLTARGLVDTTWNPDQFIEGYGPADEMGISAKVADTEIDYIDLVTPTQKADLA